MQRYIVAVILGTCWIALDPAGAGSVAQSKVSKASARFDLVPGRPELVVHLRNDWSVPLEAWHLRIECDLRDGSHRISEQGTDTATDEAEPGTPGRGPILPGETRDVRCVVDGEPLNAAVVIRTLLFEDGTVEGAADFARTLFVARERDAEVLGIWIRALKAASEVAVPQARAVLERTMASEARRIKATPGGAAGQSEYQRIAWLLGSPDDLLQSRIGEIMQRFERVRDRETRHTSRR